MQLKKDNAVKNYSISSCFSKEIKPLRQKVSEIIAWPEQLRNFMKNWLWLYFFEVLNEKLDENVKKSRKGLKDKWKRGLF